MGDLGTFGALPAPRSGFPARIPDTFTFAGQKFRVAEEVGAMPLLRFAAAADAGLDSDTLNGLVAMQEMIRDTIHPEDWTRFQRVATEAKASGEVLMAICQALYQAISARPTDRPTDSSDGPPPTSSVSSAPYSYAPPPSGPVLLQAQAPIQTPTASGGYTTFDPGLLAPLPTP